MTSPRVSVHAAARAHPTGLALRAGDHAFTYAELSAAVREVEASLTARGVRAGWRVAVRATNRVETAVWLLALMELEATAALLHPRWTDAEVTARLDDVDPHAVVTEDPHGGLSLTVRHDAPVAPDDDPVLAMVFTSGTSGRPKAAMLTHGAFVASAAASAENLGWTADDRWLLVLPLCHVGGLSVLTRCVLARRAVVLLPRFDAALVLDAITRWTITQVSVVPTMLAALLDADTVGALRGPRAVLVGGAAAPMPLMARAASRGVHALATYGLTEACSQVATQRPTEAPIAREGVGHVLSSLTLRVVDDAGEPVPTGITGRIELRGASRMRGYWGHPPLGDAWFDTGDLGRVMPDGTLRLDARRTDLIVTGGENVYPAEVEQHLAAHPDIAEAMVFGVPDPVWGQQVAALLVLRAHAPPTDAWWTALGDHLRAGLAAFKRPRRWRVVDEIPRGSTGKPDRRGAVARHGDTLEARVFSA